MKKNLDLKAKWPWKDMEWKNRAQAIAALIPSEASVLDLGGGWGYLHDLLPLSPYQSIDREAWTDKTMVADFNKNEFPDIGVFDFVVCQGVLEYMDRPEVFLSAITKYAPRAIITYNLGKNRMRKNTLKPEELYRILELAGWRVGFRRQTDKLQPDERLLCLTRI